MKFLNRKYLLIMVAIGIVSFIAYKIYFLFVLENYIVATLAVDSNREIIIWGDTFTDLFPRYYYEVKNKGKVTSPMTWIRCNNPDPKFSLIFSKDRNLVGVIENTSPAELLVINNFKTGETWPRRGDNDEWEEVNRRGRRLRNSLQIDNPQRKLVLGKASS